MTDCQMYIEVNSGGNGDFSITPIFSNGISPDNLWNNDPSGPDSVFLISPGIPLGNELNLVASDPQGLCTLEYKMCLVDSLGGGNFVTAIKVPQVTYDVQQDSTIDPIGEQFSHVEIVYENASGIYSSFNGDNSNSTFTITKVEEFEENANGEKTKKLTIDYEAILYDIQGSGNSKTINGSGIIGVAYPCLLYTSPSPRDATLSRMPSSA